MSLILKYLVPLNLVIVALGMVHFARTMATLEEAMLATEVEAMEQLAFGLKLHLESVIKSGREVEAAGDALAALTRRWPGLDLMIIDEEFRVRVASDATRLGMRWHEEGIESVLSATAPSAWNLEDHAHEGRRAIDVSVGVVAADGKVRYVVHIAKWLDRLLETIDRQRRHHLLAALLELLAVAVAVNVLNLWLVLRPLQRIRRRIADSGWLDEHPRLRRRDEIRHLGAVVSSMLAQVQARTERLRSSLGEKESALKEVAAHRDHLAHRVARVSGKLADTEERLVRAERIATLAKLSGALAHELRNPLHVIRATAETAARRCPAVASLTTDIMDEVDRVNRLITELLDYTRPSDLHWQSVDVRELLEEARRRMCRGLCERGPASCALCRVTADENAATVEADPVLLEQAVMNLVTNAREVSPEDAEIEIAATRDGDGTLVVSVADRGPGIADEDRTQVFEPFFTRKPQGTGLGLPAVQKIADLHEGSIELVPRDGGGTIARLRLPAARARGKP